MPSLYAHQIIANKVFDKMGKPNYIKNNYNEFLLGSMGLDMFSYHKLMKMMQNSSFEQLASNLKYAKHKDLLLTLIDYSKGDVKHMVYVMGFITSYAADREVRPYIHSRTEKPEGGGDTVKQIEFEQALDAYLYREKELENNVVQADFLAKIKRREMRHVSKLISSVCRHIFPGRRIWRKDIVSSYIDTMNFTKKVKSDGVNAAKKMRLREGMIGKLGRLSVYVPPQIIQGNDIFNFARRTWRAPFAIQTARHESITDLMEKSVDTAIDLISHINQYYLGGCEIDKIESLIGNINFNGREME